MKNLILLLVAVVAIKTTSVLGAGCLWRVLDAKNNCPNPPAVTDAEMNELCDCGTNCYCFKCKLTSYYGGDMAKVRAFMRCMTLSHINFNNIPANYFGSGYPSNGIQCWGECLENNNSPNEIFVMGTSAWLNMAHDNQNNMECLDWFHSRGTTCSINCNIPIHNAGGCAFNVINAKSACTPSPVVTDQQMLELCECGYNCHCFKCKLTSFFSGNMADARAFMRCLLSSHVDFGNMAPFPAGFPLNLGQQYAECLEGGTDSSFVFGTFAWQAMAMWNQNGRECLDWFHANGESCANAHNYPTKESLNFISPN